uniref:Anaphase-promoting complex subunit 4 WD40 domain-containing protein n=1 Tax=Amphimedon queenslandica TaxID=400682 RepID=A0A1X7TSA1_AMPQE
MWDLQTDEYTDVIRQSYEHVKGSKESFPILEVHFPKYSTREIHRNYTDCVRWFGRLAFSKSCENNLILWRPPQPDDKPQQKSFQVLQKFEVPNCEIWYIRFAMDRKMKYLALGNQIGEIHIWDTTQNDVIKGRPSVILSSAKCFTAVRQVTFSNDSKTIIGVCDNGTVWRWDAKS